METPSIQEESTTKETNFEEKVAVV